MQRILLGHALIASFGGIPLIYMGDELAMLNDYSSRDTPAHKHDSRWAHRPRMDWSLAGDRFSGDSPSSQVYLGTRHILNRRRALPALHAGHPTRIQHIAPPGLFALTREAPAGTLLCLFNMTESWIDLPEAAARAAGVVQMYDELSQQGVTTHEGKIALPPYARVWLS